MNRSPFEYQKLKILFPTPGGKALFWVIGCNANEKPLRPTCLVISRQVFRVLSMMGLFLTSAMISPLLIEIRLIGEKGAQHQASTEVPS